MGYNGYRDLQSYRGLFTVYGNCGVAEWFIHKFSRIAYSDSKNSDKYVKSWCSMFHGDSLNSS